MASTAVYKPMSATAEDGSFVKFSATRGRCPRTFICTLLVLLLVTTTVLSVVFIALYATRSESQSNSHPTPPTTSSTSTTSSTTSSTTTSPTTSPTPSPTTSPTPSNVCQTKACFDVAVQILGAMDEEVDPCEDFYNFTCGNWARFHALEEFGLEALILQQYAVYNDLSDVLETNFTDGNDILKELKDLYSSCIIGLEMDKEEIIEAFIPAIRQLYQKLGGWDVVNITGDGTNWTINSTQFIKEKRFGSEAFYSISVGFDEDAFKHTLEIDQGGLTLDSPYLYNIPNVTEGLEDLIIVFLTELAQVDEPTEAINNTAADIVQLETQLAGIWGADYLIMNVTVDYLYNLWNNNDWLGVLQGVFQPSGVNISGSSVVNIENELYFANLSSILENTTNEVLENYAKWQLTWELAQVFLPDDDIRNAMIHFKETFLGKPSMKEKQECVAMVDSVMPIALGRVYAKYILPSGYKEAGMELVTKVMAGLKDRMVEASWLDSTTRQRSIEKLEAIQARVAYPNRTFDDKYLESLYGMYNFNGKNYVQNVFDYFNISNKIQFSMVYKPINRSEWLTSPSTVNAYYIPEFNQISILEAIMRTPTFSTEWPISMQYGALGTILGHELTHGFDNNGRKFDKNGRRRMWWTQEAIRNFNEHAECFVEQYSNYELYGYWVDGNQTLGENIADNGGIHASYDAYQKVAGNGKILPGLTQYSDDQLFFIAFGQLWCSYLDENSYITSLYDVHSPAPFRVIGTLSNSKSFSKAFNCPADSPMNPPDKCLLW